MKSYEIHVHGELPGDVFPELGRLQVTVDEPRTVLRRSIRGQAALRGILLRLQRLGIGLVEMRQLPDDPITGCTTVSVEIVVTGALGDVAARAFADAAVERRQVLVVSPQNTLDALSWLTASGVEVLTVRERADHNGRSCSPHVSREWATGPGRSMDADAHPRQCPQPGGATSTHQVVQILERLTDREREVLGHLSELLTTEEIAKEMFISVNTVRTHIRNILRKMAASRRNEAVRRARALELIPI